MTGIPRRPLSDSEAERGLRDLMGLLALPALWNGRGNETIIQIMTEAVERIVPLRFSLTHAILIPEHPAADVVRADNRKVPDELLGPWQLAVETWPKSRDVDARVFSAQTPLGEMRVVRFSMGYGQNSAHIWFGSSEPNFPLPTQLAFLRAAVSLAMTGMQTARANYDREKASRAKDEFLAMLGHELRNPLAPIVTALELIKLKNSNTLTLELAVIDRQVEQLQRLVDDLLDMSRITQGKVELKKEAVEIHSVLQRAIEDIRPLFGKKRHAIITNFQELNVQVNGDVTRLLQVFTNLLINAAKYTDPGGCLWITTRVKGEQVTVAFKDNGTGIDEKLLPRLFNMFEQGAATIDRSKGGLGIGLTIVKNFVELHGGTVTATSEGTGRGATFTVSLPTLKDLIEAEEKIADPGHASPALAKAPELTRVLLVDDNRDALGMMELYLRAENYQVLAVADPLEALLLIDEFQPTVAILDIGLPVMDGYELAQECRTRFPQLHLIALTGYGQEKDRKLAASAGFNFHLVKPVELGKLKEVMRAVRDVGSK